MDPVNGRSRTYLDGGTLEFLVYGPLHMAPSGLAFAVGCYLGVIL
ncbi:hypothetical protein [Gordonia sp. AC31]|nr:hypothetical protein [Gordonia sp. AC31]MDT0223851.1 hypothetical protein [Gordonia sp. AC31]